MIAYTREYLETLQAFYRETFRNAKGEIDDINRSYDIEELQELKRRNNNETLEEFVTNSKSFSFYSEYKRKARMIQKRDPIYQDPTHPFIKAHFYAPRKMIAGVFYPTLWVNVAVIWLMTFLTYLMLYFRVLKKLLDIFEGAGAQKN